MTPLSLPTTHASFLSFYSWLVKFVLWPSSLIQIIFQFLFHSSWKLGGMHVCVCEYGCVCLFELFGMAVESKHDSGMHHNLVLKCGFVPVYTIILEDSKNGCPRTQWFLTSQLFQTWRSQTAILAPSAVLGFTSEFPSLWSHYLPWYLSGSCWWNKNAWISSIICQISQRMYI